MKKITDKLIFTFFTFLIINANSCKEKCNCDEVYKKIPESTKEWFWFGNGSTWIYRLAEDTTVFDTMTIVRTGDQSSNKSCSSEFSPAIGCSEVLKLIFEHSNTKYFPKYNVDTLNGDLEILDVFTSHGGREMISLDRDGNEGVILAFPFIKGEFYGRYTLVDTLSQFKLLNNKYSNVIHSSAVTTNPIKSTADIWWGKGVGLLKLVKTDGIKIINTWELMKYDIKP